VLENDAEQEISKIIFSNDTAQRRIEELSSNTGYNVANKLKMNLPCKLTSPWALLVQSSC
jgi:urease accessory protein UreE